MTDASSSNGYPGQQPTTAAGSQFNAHAFHGDQANGLVRTMLPVKIVAVHGGGVGPPPTVDVQPLINMVDRLGNSVPHGTVYGIPTTRCQAGGSVIINDPIVGDIGMMSVSDRDMSALVANKGQASNPGSSRRFDLSDGVYHGPMLNQGTPKQYIQFLNNSDGSGNGFKIIDAFGNTFSGTSAGLNLNGLIVDQHGNLTTPGGVQAGTGTADSVTLQKHTHPTTTAPTPGT